MKNWKTTLMGVLALAATGWKIYNAKTVDAQDMAAITGGLGLIGAKDGNVTGGTVQQ